MGINAKKLGEKEFNRNLLSQYWVSWVFDGIKLN